MFTSSVLNSVLGSRACVMYGLLQVGECLSEQRTENTARVNVLQRRVSLLVPVKQQ